MALRLEQAGHTIASVDDWYRHAPPMGRALHWRDGRSAKELAKAWCRDGSEPCPPRELLDLLSGIPSLSQLDFLVGYPELRVRFDNAPGEPRNTDLALLCDSLHGRVAISIEAKATESFGRTLGEEIVGAAGQWIFSERASKLKRLQALVEALLPARQEGQVPLSDVRYQLLTAVAGAWAFAARHTAPVAVFVVHEFLPAEADLPTVRENEKDLNCAVARMTRNRVVSLAPGELVGPLDVPPSEFWPGVRQWYVGKCRTIIAPPPAAFAAPA